MACGNHLAFCVHEQDIWHLPLQHHFYTILENLIKKVNGEHVLSKLGLTNLKRVFTLHKVIPGCRPIYRQNHQINFHPPTRVS